MPDIKIVFNPITFEADYQIGDGVLQSDFELATSVTLALMTDRRADDDDEIPDGSGDRRGCWGDEQSEELWSVGLWGSKLWLRRRLRASERTRTLIEADIREALEWFQRPENLIADEVAIETEFTGPPESRALLARVTLIRPNENPLALRYENIWNEFT